MTLRTVRTVAVLVAVSAAVLAAGTQPARACSGSCYSNAFGCINPGNSCFDPITGCGRCRNVAPFGPCLCDASWQPEPEPWVPWFTETELEEPSEFGLELQRRGPSTAPVTTAPLPVPEPGDRLCAEQIGATRIVHHYNLPWGIADPDRLEVRGARFCVDVVDRIDDDPDWLQFEVVSLRGFLPSFRPRALPAFETGDNHVVLDSLPSRGKLHLPTLTVVAEVRARLVNDLFRYEFPVPLRAGLRGTLDLERGRLQLQAAHLDATTPPDYGGPFPE